VPKNYLREAVQVLPRALNASEFDYGTEHISFRNAQSKKGEKTWEKE
jgi:hypothetical protein